MSEIQNQTPKPKKAGVLYRHDASGQIMRQETAESPVQVIATIKDGVLTFPGPVEQRKAPAVLRYCKAVGLEVKQTVTAAGGAVEQKAAIVAHPMPPVSDGGSIAGRPLGLWEAGPGMPPCPPMDKMAGDKTPERVEWLKLYKPDEFARIYKVQGEGFVPQRKVVLDRTGRRTVETVQKPGLIAGRKTHLTIKPQS